MALQRPLRKTETAEMPNPRLFMVLYSPPKVGKTRFCATALEDPRLKPALMLDFEGGTSVIQSKVRPITINEIGKPAPEQEKQMDLYRITRWQEINTVIEKIASSNLYRFVAVDSLTELSWLALMSKAEDKNLAYPELRVYAELTVDMRGFTRAFRDHVKAHVIFTAHTKERERKEGGNDMIVPAMAGNEVTRDITGVVDLLGYLERRKVGMDSAVTTLYFESRGAVLAGARVEDPDFPTKFENPTVGDVLTALEGGKDQ